MQELVQFGVQASKVVAPEPRAVVLWLQGITLVWMLVEFGVCGGDGA